jgi:hypothetical protein
VHVVLGFGYLKHMLGEVSALLSACWSLRPGAEGPRGEAFRVQIRDGSICRVLLGPPLLLQLSLARLLLCCLVYTRVCCLAYTQVQCYKAVLYRCNDCIPMCAVGAAVVICYDLLGERG